MRVRPWAMMMMMMMMLTALACAVGGGSSSSSAASSSYDRVRAVLAESVTQYAEVRTRGEVEAQLERVLRVEACVVIIHENRIFASRRFLYESKTRKHALMLVSAARRVKLPNVAYLFDRDSTGEELHNSLSAVGGLAAEVPIAVISKRFGHGQPGILVPNPFFREGNLTLWGAFTAALAAGADQKPWAARDRRLFWRGNIGHHDEDCVRDAGNHARLAAMALTSEDPAAFDVRCAKCHPRNGRLFPCAAWPYDAAMDRLALENCSSIQDTAWVDPEDYAAYQFVLNLPGTTSGGYSRNLNHLWAIGAVIVLWATDVVEWYYPALDDFKTHVTVDKANASRILADLRQQNENYEKSGGARGGRGADPHVHQKKKPHSHHPLILIEDLRANARHVNDNLLCPHCLATYLRDFATAVRHRLGQALVLDDDGRTRALFERSCAIPDLVELGRDPKSAKGLKALPIEPSNPLHTCTTKQSPPP